MSKQLQICIYGAGAVGSHIAVRLAALESVSLSLVARGEHLLAIQKNGLTLLTNAEKHHVLIPQAVDNASLLGAQDIVIVTLKANALPAQAQAIARLLKPGGYVLFLNNGIPWWWNHGLPQAPAQSLPLLDPEQQLWHLLGPEHVLAGVVQSPNELEAPGVVRHRGHNLFLLGEPDLSQSTRLQQIHQLFNAAGLNSQCPADIRQSIWQKLLINASGNPISALTRLDTQARAQDASLQGLAQALQDEIKAIAKAMGWDLATAENPLGNIKPQDSQSFNARPSMLQDVLRGRPLEVDALLGQPAAFARAYGVHTPALDVVLPLLRGLNQAVNPPC